MIAVLLKLQEVRKFKTFWDKILENLLKKFNILINIQQIFNIDLNIFEKEKHLGSGSYGNVYLVHKKQDKTKLFAAKEMISKISDSLLKKINKWN